MSIDNDEQKTHLIFRISDIVKEPLEILPSITGYEDLLLVSLENAIEPLISILPNIQSYAESAKQLCRNPPADELTIDESASIMLYSMGWKPLDQCLYVALNNTLRLKDKDKLEPWFLYLKLFLTALSRLPSVGGNIYRGIKLDLSQQYQIGQTFSWSEFSSCTNLINVLQSEYFLDITDERTLFTIESYSSKDIHKHSYLQSEEEFIFLPATKFSVQANFKKSNGIHTIRLKEINQCEKSNVEPELTFESNIHDNKISLLNDFTIAGGNGAGDKLNQLHYPLDVYVNDDQSIYVADFCNHRIVEWKHGETSGQVVAGGNGMGDDWNQLNCPTNVILDKEKNNLIICDMQNKRLLQWPRQNGTSGEPILSDIDCMGVAMDNNGDFYVSNKTANEVRRWEIGDIEAVGILVAGGNGKGNNLNQLSFPTCIFVDEDHSVYVSDSQNNRVMKWMENAEEGIVVAGGNGKGNGLNQLSHPTGLFVDQLGTVYVADLYNHRIMRWPKGATEGNIVNYGNEELEQGNKFDRPQGISFDREGNLYIVDSTNDRVQRYNIDRS